MVAWLLVFHLLGLIFWLGTLFALTRILAVHTEEASAEARSTLARLEAMLFNRIAHPAAVVVILAGIGLIFTNPGYFLHARWLHAKLLLVFLLLGLDLWLYAHASAMQAERENLSRGECAAFGATIAATLLGILILVLVKPF